MRRLVLLLAGLLALAACGSDAAGSDGGGSDGGGNAAGPTVAGEWELTGGTADGVALPRPPGARATLDLTGDEARGTAFCNHWFGTVRSAGSSFALADVGSTQMACEPDVMAAESAFLAALGAVDTARRDGAELVLSGDGVELRFGPVGTVPDSPLEGTRWVLESLVDGATASSVIGEPAVLLLGDDGRVEAGTGCRALTAAWTDDDGALVLADLVPDGAPCPPDAERQDGHVTAVLGAGPVLHLAGDRLTLTAPDGRGLVYRAEA